MRLCQLENWTEVLEKMREGFPHDRHSLASTPRTGDWRMVELTGDAISREQECSIFLVIIAEEFICLSMIMDQSQKGFVFAWNNHPHSCGFRIFIFILNSVMMASSMKLLSIMNIRISKYVWQAMCCNVGDRFRFLWSHFCVFVLCSCYYLFDLAFICLNSFTDT